MSEATSPGRTGAALAVLLSLVSLAVLLWHTGLYRVVPIAAVTGVVAALSGLVGARDSPLWASLASLLFVCAAGLLLAGLGLATLVPAGGFAPAESLDHLRPVLLLVCVCCLAAGATILPWQGTSGRIARSLVLTAGAVCIPLGAVFVLALAVLPALAGVITPLIEFTLRPSESPETPGTLLLLAGVTAVAVGALLVRLPLPALVQRGRSPAVRGRLHHLYRLSFAAGIGSLIVGIVVFLSLPPLWERLPAAGADAILLVSSSRPVRLTLLALTGVAVSFVSLFETLRRVRPGLARPVLSMLARATGAILLVSGLVVLGPESVVDTAMQLLEQNGGEGAERLADVRSDVGGTTLVTGAVFGGPALLAVLVCLGGLLGYLGLVPRRTAGAVLATGGTIVATVVAGLIAGPSVLLFAVVGLALVGWDVAAYSHRLTVEVERGSRRLQLVHFGTVLPIALVSVGFAYGGLVFTRTVLSDTPAAAAIAALVGLLLLASILRA